jgi:hypothetical protein
MQQIWNDILILLRNRYLIKMSNKGSKQKEKYLEKHKLIIRLFPGNDWNKVVEMIVLQNCPLFMLPSLKKRKHQMRNELHSLMGK